MTRFFKRNNSFGSFLKAIILTILLILFCVRAEAKSKLALSDKSTVSLVTLGPYESELYSVFGHTLIRIEDSVHGIDWVYNFGLFDFNRPNFYLNFARGFLLYEVGKGDFTKTYGYYSRIEDRDISSLTFNLTLEERQVLFDNLEEYILPENRTYYYDYFYNNCSTMVRDLLEKTMKESFHKQIVLKTQPYATGATFGALVRERTTLLPWGGLGIDVALGRRMDKKLTTRAYTFLPTYLEQYMSNAYLMPENKKLTSEIKFLHQRTSTQFIHSYFTPKIIFWGCLLVVIGISLMEKKTNSHYKYFDLVLFAIIGCFGTFLLSIGLFTNHEAAKYNLDIAWALPLHFLTAGLIFRQVKGQRWCRIYLYFIVVFNLLLILFWSVLPQYLDTAFIPIVFLILIRIMSFLLYKHNKNYL